MSSAPPLKRVIALLWRSQVSGEERRHPGPRPRLDVDRILDEAVALADENPSAGVSMRALAGRLGVTPMTLYGYVPDKGTLLALMYDSIHAEMPRVVGEGISGVVDWVEEVVEVYLRHPWRSEEHTSELQSRENLVCRLLLEKKKTKKQV